MTRDFVKNRSVHSRQVSNSIPIPTPPLRLYKKLKKLELYRLKKRIRKRVKKGVRTKGLEKN